MATGGHQITRPNGQENNMEMEIKSRKLGKTIKFSCPGDFTGHIFVNLNGQPGNEGNIICHRDIAGIPIGYWGKDKSRFEAICKRWYRSYINGQ